MDIPVYLVAGFLDSGKTSFINGILEDGFARVTVTDNGRGIERRQLEHLFDGKLGSSAEHRGDSTRSMGIGLSVCKTIVTAHGGEISAHNVPHGGAQFIFTLPLGGQEDYEYQG